MSEARFQPQHGDEHGPWGFAKTLVDSSPAFFVAIGSDAVGLRFPLDRAGATCERISRPEPVIIDGIRAGAEPGRIYRDVVGDLLETPPFRQIRS